MALVVGNNSYITLAEAEGLVLEELESSSPEYIAWSKLSDQDKEIVCKRGTMEINTLHFKGASLVYKYNLKFPRLMHGVEIIPEAIKIATLIQGINSKIVKSGKQYNMIANGIKSISTGPNSVSFDTEKFNGSKICEMAMVYLETYVKKTG